MNIQNIPKTYKSISEYCRDCHANSRAHGFWKEDRNKGEMLALIHSEVSECLEGIRKPQQDDHIPQFTMEEAELADICIRVFDYAGGFGFNLQAAIDAKMKYNESRPYMHGKAL